MSMYGEKSAGPISQPIDWHDVDQVLRDNVETLVVAFRGEKPNPVFSSRHEKRWGHKGSLAVTIYGRYKGRISDFESDEYMTPLQFVMRERRCSFREAVEWSTQWLGLGSDQLLVSISTSPRVSSRESGKPEETQIRDQRRRIEKARSIAAGSVPAQGTLAERYLRETRGIVCEALPDQFRFVSQTEHGCPALLVTATDENAETCAVQRIFLNVNAEKVAVVNGTRSKQTNGVLDGAAVRLAGRPSSRLYLTEGPENGLAVWSVCCSDVWVALGSIAKLAEQVPVDRQIIIVRDGDLPGSTADVSLRRGIERMVGRGCHVRVTATPADKDANDVLRERGGDGLSHLLENAERYSSAPPKYQPPRKTLAEAEDAVRSGLSRFIQATVRYARDLEAYNAMADCQETGS